MSSKKTIKIGTRGSKLALWQAEWVKSQLTAHNPGLTVDLLRIKTSGDKILDVPLAKVGGKGLFVKEIEEALMSKKVDLAVHSMKDVPTDLPESLYIAAVTKREDPRDVLISRNKVSLRKLPPGAKIGTSSLRRQSQLLKLRPDFQMITLRGNLDTRLRKLETEGLEAIVLAAAGVKRLGYEDSITEYLDPFLMLPAIGQGALGIEIRRNDDFVKKLVAVLDDPETHVTVLAERAFLRRLQGGCQVPFAAHALVKDGKMHLKGLVASVDGQRIVAGELEGDKSRAEALGVELAEKLIRQGAGEIIQEVYLRP
jgi:hydroxymethylbilane synthase